MVSLLYEARFKKDFKQHLKNPNNKDLNMRLAEALEFLVVGSTLPVRYKDHPLKGGYMGYRELHLKPDLLLIYKRADVFELRLARLGTHSDLF